jgi:hypothetical protein
MTTFLSIVFALGFVGGLLFVVRSKQSSSSASKPFRHEAQPLIERTPAASPPSERATRRWYVAWGFARGAMP